MMNQTMVIGFTSSFSVAIPLAFGSYRLKRLNHEMKILLALFVITLLVEGYSVWQFLIHGNSQWIHHVYTPLEYAFLMTIFSYWQRGDLIKRALRYSIPIFILVCLVSMLFEDLNSLNGFTESLACLIYVPVSAYTLLNLFENEEARSFREARNWISAGLLLYSSGSLGFFAFHNLMPGGLTYKLWVFHSFLNVSANTLYAIGFVCPQRN